MCEDEVVGDWYRGCGHFVKIYDTGERFDCEDQLCALSKDHVHTALNCPCPKEPRDRCKIQSMFHQPCEDCRNAEFARLVGR